MRQYVVKRVLLYFPTLVLISVLVFLLMRVIPGDPAIQLLAAGGDASYTEEELAEKRADLGIDRPLPVQYVDWIWGMLRGDLGLALYYQRPVVEELSPRIPITFEIAFLAMIISIILAVPLGIVSAITQDSLFDYIGRGFTIFGISVPHIRNRDCVHLHPGPRVQLAASIWLRQALGSPLGKPPTDILSGAHPRHFPDEFHCKGHPFCHAGSAPGGLHTHSPFQGIA